MFRVLNDNNGRGGVWAQGGSGADRTRDGLVDRNGAPFAGDLAGSDTILGMGGNDVIVGDPKGTPGGADTIFGGPGSDRVREAVGGNFILGDQTHPGQLGATEGWGAAGGPGDRDVVSYAGSEQGIFVTGVSYGMKLGKELRAYGYEDPNAGGDVTAYVVQNNAPGKLDWLAAQRLGLEELRDGLKADVLVGVEVLRGTEHRDVFVLHKLDDTVFAGAGNDWIDTREGDDVIAGQAGNDRILTGEGKDRAIFDARTDGHDVVTDFDLRTRASELDWDTLALKLDGGRRRIDDAQDLADAIVFIEKDGDGDTDALRDGDDLVLDFGVSSIRLVGVLDDLEKPEAAVAPSVVDGAGGPQAFLWSDVIDPFV